MVFPTLVPVLQALIAGRGVNDTQDHIVVAEVQQVYTMLQQSGALPACVGHPVEIATRMMVLRDLVAAESDFECLQVGHPQAQA